MPFQSGASLVRKVVVITNIRLDIRSSCSLMLQAECLQVCTIAREHTHTHAFLVPALSWHFANIRVPRLQSTHFSFQLKSVPSPLPLTTTQPPKVLICKNVSVLLTGDCPVNKSKKLCVELLLFIFFRLN